MCLLRNFVHYVVFVDLYVVTVSYSVGVLVFVLLCSFNVSGVLISTLHSYFFPNRAKHTIMKTRKKNNLKYTVKASTNALVLPFYWSRLALSPFFCILTHVSFSAIVLLYSLPYIHLLHLQ